MSATHPASFCAPPDPARPASPAQSSPSTLDAADEKAPPAESGGAAGGVSTHEGEKGGLAEELEGGVILAGQRGAVAPAGADYPDGGWRAWR